jgi:hypothetical protein
MSSLLRQVLSLTLAALSSPVQAGSRRNASRAADAERLNARGGRRRGVNWTRRPRSRQDPVPLEKGEIMPATDRI